MPKHRAPDVVIASGMTEDGYVPVDPATLATRFPGVYAVGDVATAGVPKAGVFAEGAARVVAAALIAELRGGEPPGAYDGRGTCYIEFGDGRIGARRRRLPLRPEPTGTFSAPSAELRRREGALRLEPPRALVRRLTVRRGDLPRGARSGAPSVVRAVTRPRRLHALGLAGHLRIVRRIGHIGAPSASSRSYMSSSGWSEWARVVDGRVAVADLGEAGGHRLDVEALGLSSPSSSHAIGAETVAPGFGRTLYADAMVRSRAFWL